MDDLYPTTEQANSKLRPGKEVPEAVLATVLVVPWCYLSSILSRLHWKPTRTT